ncbi:MAG: cytochrome b5 domain-containing protein [Methanothermobacter sp.]|jgi:predicted heme/steroid binding protein|uniref:cytochrome b5 domain-containing protein n=1 Tax=Methanothermobacter tenebrarum TaxID=680118 RepID=UPI0020C01967|nr:cytochrome b5 domain-containing protein [Methanothermobacter tenebrarum]MDD3454711.1 cytochrome b5 domain-containing protein [Methanobacteriales archaeon]MDI6881283.1 cytochrome b5 domain-containing protein [Methanothermobacter sp.]MDX9693182.1 cytochrome b5 domain-containing protein [Methanothermobacter sp.]HOQ20387.1 cytochrome b5 domain-containing protein [Methanothermobacter sp.]
MEFTLEDLKKFNGKDGAPAYVGCNGKVYDVSGSFLWKDGEHQVTHRAGRDLSDEIRKAPHGIELLEKFPIIGVLKR